MNSIAINLDCVKECIEAAVRHSGGDPTSVKHMAVCKKKPVSMVEIKYK